MVLNLLGSALKFTPAGGTVTLRLERQAGGLRLEVRDTGSGIAPEDIGKLFCDFTRLSAGEGGTSLGLALSKPLVTLHGGSIGVESRPGEGSLFWMLLPARG